MPKSFSQITKLTDSVFTWVTAGTFFLLPLIFNPATADLFDLNKRLLLAVSSSIILILWMARNILTRSFKITLTPFTLPLIALTLVTLFSSYGSLLSFTENFITTTSTYAFLALLFLAITTNRGVAHHTHLLLNSLIASGVVLAVLAILETIGLGPTKLISLMDPSIAGQQGIFLSPAGSAIILIVTLIPLLVLSLLTAVNSKLALEKGLFFLSSALMTAALIVSVFTVLPGKPNSPVFLSFGASWQIAAENIKTPKSFLLGVGAGNYTAAFSANRPITFNNSDFWNNRFGAARNLPLHLFTTTGVVGFASWILLILGLFRLSRRFTSLSQTSKVALITTGTVVIINLLLPSNTVTLSLFIFLLAVLALELKNQKEAGTSELILKLFAAKVVNSASAEALASDTPAAAPVRTKKDASEQTQLLPAIIGIPVALFALFILYGAYRVAAADIKVKAAFQAAAGNNGTGTYDNQRQALAANPFMSSYHRSYANTNLLLATAISQNQELTDQDKNNISQLIQQSIREAKAAVQINPTDPANWEALAVTYRNLINVADGATDWANASYLEAIRRDPLNPRLRLELGGIYFQLQDYPSAIRLFQQAADLKPNWPNAHYNLAVAYAANKELERAIVSYDAVLQLIEPTSADYAKALEEQNTLKKQLGQKPTEAQQAGGQGQLQSPAPLPSPLPGNEQVQLDQQQAAPPTSGFQTSPTPTPSPTPAQ